MDNRTSMIVDRTAFMIVYTTVAVLSLLQLIHDRLLTKRNEIVGQLQRMFHVLTFVGGAAFMASLAVMYLALNNRGVMTAEQQVISDLLYDTATQCAFTGTFFWVHHNVQQQQYLSASSAFTSSFIMRLGSSRSLTTVLATILWIVAGVFDILMYVTNIGWFNAIYLLVMAVLGTVLIGIANWCIYQLLRAMAAHGLVTDAVSTRRRNRRIAQLKRFIRTFTFVYILIIIGITVSVVDAFADLSAPYAQIPPADPDDFDYTFDPLMVLVLAVLALFVWHAWRPTTLLCSRCIYVEPKEGGTTSDHTATMSGDKEASAAGTAGNGGANGGAMRSPKRSSVNSGGNHKKSISIGNNGATGNRVIVLQPTSPLGLHGGHHRVIGARATSGGSASRYQVADNNNTTVTSSNGSGAAAVTITTPSSVVQTLITGVSIPLQPSLSGASAVAAMDASIANNGNHTHRSNDTNVGLRSPSLAPATTPTPHSTIMMPLLAPTLPGHHSSATTVMSTPSPVAGHRVHHHPLAVMSHDIEEQ